MVEGKRAGARRAAPSSTGGGRGRLAALALGITLTLVAWGYLVWLAIDFGVSARSGEAAGWWMLALASLGAIACLFVALILVSQVLRALSITREGGRGSSGGGRRAAR